MLPEALLQTHLPTLTLIARGKVRDIYALGPGPEADLLFVATDRISAFDHILATGIPEKGRVLTQLSRFWFDFLRDLTPNHLVTSNISDLPQPYQDQLAGRSMVVRRAHMFPVECVARGYLAGSGWKDYRHTGAVCGIPLPPGLRESDRLPEPLFTPAAKNHTGHDENISFDAMVAGIGGPSAEALRALTLALYTKARDHAATCGLILADTKFEFGLIDNKITLCDEALTPDSSRYWPADTYAAHLEAGLPQPSFDKQYVRDYLESIPWDKQPPAPALPAEVVARTRAKYLEAHRLITGQTTLESSTYRNGISTST